MPRSPIGSIIPYNKRIYRPYAEDAWRRYRAHEFVLIDTDEGAYVKDYASAQMINWPPNVILGDCDVWSILFDVGTTFGCMN